VNSYILDLRKEGCPMALLKAKRASQQMKQNSLEIYIADKSSMQDMVRYFAKQGFNVQSRNSQQYYTVTITKESTCPDVRNG